MEFALNGSLDSTSVEEDFETIGKPKRLLTIFLMEMSARIVVLLLLSFRA